MARRFKIPTPLVPTTSLTSDSAIEPSSAMRDRSHAACVRHIRDESLRMSALAILVDAHAWRLNAARLASDRELRRRLKHGAKILAGIKALETDNNSGRARGLERLLGWLGGLDLDARLFLGGFSKSRPVPGASTRRGALASVESLEKRLAVEAAYLRKGDFGRRGRRTAEPLDAAKMLAHVTKLADSIPPSRGGRPVGESLSWLVTQLARIWEADGNPAFRRSYKDPQYAFILGLCRAIEPEIDEGAVKTAIRVAARSLAVERERRKTPSTR